MRNEREKTDVIFCHRYIDAVPMYNTDLVKNLFKTLFNFEH